MISLASNIPLLRTGFVPDEKEAAHIRCIMTLQTATLTDIDNEISNLQRTLESLQAQRTLVSDSLTVNNSLFSPVRRLVPEILGEIFMYCIPPRSDVEFQDLRRRRRGASEALPLLLHVCHRWRDIAQGTPGLWADIPTYDHECIPYATMFLQNSGSFPLNICIHHYGDDNGSFPYALERINFRKCPEFVEVLVNKMPFVHRLEYLGPFYGLKVLFPPGNSEKRLSLKQLHLEIMPSPPGTNLDLSSLLGATNLRTLTLRADAVHLISFIKPTVYLQKLALHFQSLRIVSKAQLLSFLRLCPGIEVLEIVCSSVLHEMPAFDAENEDAITLPTLREVLIDTDDASFGSLHFIRAPNLLSGTLRYEPYDWNDLRIFLLEARKSLYKLSLADFYLSSAMLHESMKALKELETLKVSNSFNGDDLWVFMTTDMESPPTSWVCPRLAHLDICEMSLGVEFVEFIRRRTEIPSQADEKWDGAGYITDVNLLNCTIDQGHSKALLDLQLERSGLSITGLPLPVPPPDTEDEDDLSDRLPIW